MKIKKYLKWIISVIIILGIIITIILVNQKNDNKEYQLELEKTYGGTGISGQDLGSGIETETHYIKNGDKFYESVMGGKWILNYEDEEDTVKEWFKPKKILEVIELNDNSAKIEANGESKIIKFDEELPIYSLMNISDGINYSYKIKIVKNK